MSWAEIKKAVNSDLSVPLNELIDNNLNKYRLNASNNIMHTVGQEVTTKKGELPYSFTYGQAVVYKGMIHLLGGTKYTGSGAYDYTNKHTWWEPYLYTENADTLPYYGFNGTSNHGQAVVYNDEIHILGGVESNSQNHYKWNGSTWTSVSTLPYTLLDGSAVVYNDEIHILGTSSSGGNQNHYKWNGSSWTSASALPYGFYYGSAVVYNDEIHILGSIASAFYRAHYKWNGSTWTSASTLPYDFYKGQAVVYNDEIHILGGNDKNYHYKWNGSSWISDATTPGYFANGSAVVYNGEIHILGSTNTPTNHRKFDGITWETAQKEILEYYKVLEIDGFKYKLPIYKK